MPPDLPLGLDCLNGIVREIAFGDGIFTALKWHDDSYDVTAQLADFPLSGRVVPEIGRKEIRELILPHYRIIYRANAKQLPSSSTIEVTPSLTASNKDGTVQTTCTSLVVTSI